MKRMVAFLAISLLVGAAVAHEGVKNPAVMARMQNMSMIADGMKTLGQMGKSAIPFNAEQAQSATRAIARHAAETPGLALFGTS